MFFGEYEHSLDAKGRVILPAKFRERLEGGGFITKVLDGCLAVYTADEFERVASDRQEKARRGQMERNVVRAFAASTSPIDPDRQGRIAIPANLRDFAGLVEKVSINGAINRIEIWDAARWADISRQGEQSLADARAGLDDLGI